MLNIILRLFKRVFKSSISINGPVIIVIIFALAQGYFFPNSPLWLVPLFALAVIILFYRYVKW